MKYWLLTSEYPPFYGGGISTYCRFTAQMLVEKGHQVSVFVYDYSVRDIKTQTDNGIRIIRFNPSRTKSSSFLGYITNISYEYAGIVKLFIENEGKPDIIESQEYLGIAYYLLQYKYLLYDWCAGIPVIITVHSPSFLYHEFNHIPLFKFPDYWIAEMERFCLQAADILISPSQYIIQEIKKRFDISHDRFVVIPNPYSLVEQPTDKVSSNQSQPQEIIFYGKLTAQKGIFQLLKYFRKLWDENSQHQLCLIGGGDIFYHPENTTMEALIRRQNKKYIQSGQLKLKGKIKPDKLSQKLSNARIVVIPSIIDNLPYAVLETMGMGKIVLTSKQGGQAEIIEDGVDGFIFDHDHPDTFFDQLKKILELNESERNFISNNAIKKIEENYNYNTIYEQKIKIINELILHKESFKKQFPFLRAVQSDKIDEIIFPGKKDLLSIIVTFYNSGKYIDETIKSLEETDYPEKEIIIIDDGSDDPESLDKLKVYRNKKGVRVITKENKGLADTRNAGAESASGEFLAFIDADDKVDREYYSKAITVLKQYDNIHFVGAWIKYFENSDNTWPTFTPEPPLILYHNLINSAALVFKRNSFLLAGKNDLLIPFKGLEDYDSIISLIEAGFNGVCLPEVLFHYRVRHDSMYRGITLTKKLFISQYIYQKHKHIYAKFASEIADLLNSNGSGWEIDNPTLDYHLINNIGLGRKISTGFIKLVKRNKYIRSIAYKLYKTFKK